VYILCLREQVVHKLYKDKGLGNVVTVNGESWDLGVRVNILVPNRVKGRACSAIVGV
jgi:hypothetical protein